MKLLSRLLLLFIFLPAIELVLLLQFHRWTSFWATVGVIIATGILGTMLAKREGVAAWERLKASFGRGDVPGKELLDGVIVLLAGALLITPGLLTDVVGFLGLLPPTRALIRQGILRRIKARRSHGLAFFGFGSVSERGFDTGSTYEEPVWKGQGRETPGYRSDDLTEPPRIP